MVQIQYDAHIHRRMYCREWKREGEPARERERERPGEIKRERERAREKTQSIKNEGNEDIKPETKNTYRKNDAGKQMNRQFRLNPTAVMANVITCTVLTENPKP